MFTVELLKVQTTKDLIAEMQAPGLAYLEMNGKKEGVTTTESGLQYKVLESGEGASPAGPSSSVTVHYAGRLIDGTEFDSSYRRGEPATFGLNQVIPGWTEGVQLMKEGDKFEFTIPFELGYGARGSGQNIPPYATLIFDVELIKVND
ncbi:FKBP-type peptidyl-prolyl cis-trans isomerase [Kordiimonas sediminis]|uniref:FKBP-type peptidyl-prolyl cis-trans isomerase n=1 Tax=Kordiimonas sediminis TaxID=1735581 RepID=UPI00227D91FF|nr:FKBP-type peptidyl-prolyl cis-trans isomerase [Kordiimonas sediminis]